MPGKGKNILIVDDVSHLRDAIMFEFEEEGYNVFGAQSGEEAFEILSQQTIHLVITDIRMPHGSGTDLLTKLKQKNPLFPHVFLLTAFSDVSSDEIFAKGAEMVFAKPFDPSELIREARKYLEGHQNEWEPDSVQDLSMSIQSLKFRGLATDESSNGVVLGRGGLFLPHNQMQAKKGDVIKFEMAFEKGEIQKLDFVGVVEWVRNRPSDLRRDGLGIRFLGVNPVHAKRLVDVLRHHEIIPFIPLGKKAKGS
ncbi:MAG: response regulator [Deltaproteobacteria bacterium]|nr:response regulator [Deltaproteobacteria bacterium]